MAQPTRIPATVAVAVAVVAAAAASGCTSQSVCASARATAAAVESTADAAADAFCGTDAVQPSTGAAAHDGGAAPATLDPASTDASTISAADTDGGNEQMPSAEEEKAEGQLQEPVAFDSVSNRQ